MVLKNKCPRCGASPCQISFTGHVVECSNDQCPNYCADLYPPKVDALPPALDDYEEYGRTVVDANKGTDAAAEEEDLPAAGTYNHQRLDDDGNTTNPPASLVGGESPLPEYTWLDGHYDFGDC